MLDTSHKSFVGGLGVWKDSTVHRNFYETRDTTETRAAYREIEEGRTEKN